MKQSVLRKVGSAFLIIGLTVAIPAYAEKHGMGAMGMGEKAESNPQQMSGMMHDMSGEMMEMSGMMERGTMNPDAMKKMSGQMKQMGGMMNDMSGMMGKETMMDADMQKKMGQMRKQMEQMRKDMPASPAKN